MSFIDISYFVGNISIGNISGSVATDRISDSMQTFIDRYEKEILIDALGYTLYKALITGLDETTPLQKWLDLRDGAEYEVDYNGETHLVKWNGLINDDKQSLLAYFIYYYYMTSKLTIGKSGGFTKSNFENGDRADGANKLVSAWNDGIKLYGELPINNNLADFNYSNRYNAGGYFRDGIGNGCQYPFFGCQANVENSEFALIPSLHNFIYFKNKENSDTYPKWIFTQRQTINQFSI